MKKLFFAVCVLSYCVACNGYFGKNENEDADPKAESIPEKNVVYEIQEVSVKVQDGEQENIDINETLPPYQVGSYYNVGGYEGVVFEVSDDGFHGKIVSLNQTKAAWNTKVVYDPTYRVYVVGTGVTTGANNENDGMINTNIVMSRDDNNMYPAFAWCRDMGDGWYMPVVDELLAIYANVNIINATLHYHAASVITPTLYWSSTESDEFCAHLVRFESGKTTCSTKSGNYYVRAVCAF